MRLRFAANLRSAHEKSFFAPARMMNTTVIKVVVVLVSGGVIYIIQCVKQVLLGRPGAMTTLG